MRRTAFVWALTGWLAARRVKMQIDRSTYVSLGALESAVQDAVNTRRGTPLADESIWMFLGRSSPITDYLPIIFSGPQGEPFFCRCYGTNVFEVGLHGFTGEITDTYSNGIHGTHHDESGVLPN